MQTTKEKPAIQIENAGPIEGVFSIDLSHGPGLYELRGGKGTGKSTSLRCIESLISGHSVGITVNEGNLSGQVTGFGVVAPIGSKKRFRGDFEANALDSERFSLTDITDPPIKDAAKADAHRIKALASLCRTKADPSAYYHLIGTRAEFEAIIRADRLDVEDPVTLASRIKSDLDGAARLKESLAASELAHAKAAEDQIATLDTSAPSDARELASAADQAVSRVKELEARQNQAKRAAAEIDAARKNLDNLRNGYKGLTIEDARIEVEIADNELQAAKSNASDIEEEIRTLQAQHKEATTSVSAKVQGTLNAKRALEAAEQNAKLVKQCETLIASQAEISPPDLAEVQEAINTLTMARAAEEQGVRVRDAIETKLRADRHRSTAEKAEKEAEKLRAASAATFDVLAASVKLDAIKIESVQGEPRLVVKHPKRKGSVLFSDLSDGERVRLTMDATASLIPSPGLFPIGQRLWQDLPPKDRQEIHEYAIKRGLYVFAAQVSDDPLSVHYYGNGKLPDMSTWASGDASR